MEEATKEYERRDLLNISCNFPEVFVVPYSAVTSPKEMLRMAEAVARIVHGKEVDKAGKPYLFHLDRVSARCNTEEEKVVAYLHDVLETDSTRKKLLNQIFPAYIVDVVVALTHNKNEPRVEYYHRIKACGDLAVRVKLADIADNSDESRLSYLSQSDQVRLREKYRKAKEILQSE